MGGILSIMFSAQAEWALATVTVFLRAGDCGRIMPPCCKGIKYSFNNTVCFQQIIPYAYHKKHVFAKKNAMGSFLLQKLARLQGSFKATYVILSNTCHTNVSAR